MYWNINSQPLCLTYILHDGGAKRACGRNLTTIRTNHMRGIFQRSTESTAIKLNESSWSLMIREMLSTARFGRVFIKDLFDISVTVSLRNTWEAEVNYKLKREGQSGEISHTLLGWRSERELDDMRDVYTLCLTTSGLEAKRLFYRTYRLLCERAWRTCLVKYRGSMQKSFRYGFIDSRKNKNPQGKKGRKTTWEALPLKNLTPSERPVRYSTIGQIWAYQY